MALPAWSGADRVYDKAQWLLERMARSGHVSKGIYGAHGRDVKGKAIMSVSVVPSQAMVDLIDAMNSGDEERLKGLILTETMYL